MLLVRRARSAPQVKRWGPEFQPRGWNVEESAFRNWINLERCVLCQALWFVSVHTGHSPQRYRVRWPHSVEDWMWLESLDGGQSLGTWHDDQLMSTPGGKSPGRVDLELLLRGRQDEPS